MSFVTAVIQWRDYNICKQEEQGKGDLVSCINPSLTAIMADIGSIFESFVIDMQSLEITRKACGNTRQKRVYKSHLLSLFTVIWENKFLVVIINVLTYSNMKDKV